MNICHLSRLHSLGGVQRSLAAFINATAGKYGLDQKLITGSRLHPFISDQILSTGIPVYYFARLRGLPIPKYPPQVRRWFLTRLIKKADPEALIFWDYSQDYHAVSAAHKIGAKVIYFERGAAWGYKGNHRRRRVFEGIDGALCNSFAAKRVLELKWGMQKPIIICRNALRAEMQPPTIQAKSFPMGRPIRLGAAGRLESVKGLGVAIHTCSILLKKGLEVSLQIAGEGRQRSVLQRLITELGIADHCQLLGSVRDMRSFFKEQDIVLVPSIYEPFGLVSIEAQAWGCVVVVAGVDGLAETVAHTQTGAVIKPTLPLADFHEFMDIPGYSERFYYDPEDDAVKPLRLIDPEEMAKSVQVILSEPDRFESMSRFASNRIMTEFRFDENIREIIEAICLLTGTKTHSLSAMKVH